MKVRSYLEIFVLGYIFCLSDGAVSISPINTLDNVQHLECGTTVILKCDTPASTSDMSWKVDGTIEADCVFGTCGDYPPFPGSYSFTDDQTNGVFNLTINPVKFTDNGKTFTCTVSDAATFSPVVKVLPADSSCSLTPTAGSGSVSFVATTGCIYPESEVDIKWYYLKEIGGSAVEVSSSDFSYTSTTSLDGSTCVSGDCSSGTGVTVVSETALFQLQPDGLEVYIQAKFTHSASSSVVFKNSTSSYKIKKATPDPYKCLGLGEHKATDTKAKCVCAWLGIVCAILLCLFIIGILVEYKGEIWDDDEIPFFLWILLFIIIVGFGILALAKIRNCAAMEDKRPEEQPMTETKTDV